MTICTCAVNCERELIAAWDRRAHPILRRWLEHGHALDPSRILRTKNLARALARGDDQAISAAFLGTSHHLPGCPWKGNRHVR